MSCATPIELPTPARPVTADARRVSRLWWLVLAILLSWGAEYAVYTGFAPHGVALRHELRAAAAVLQTPLTLQPTPALSQAIGRHFPGSGAEIDTTGHWPVVTVSLHGLSREDCLDALRDARRIDGPVVVALQGYGSAEDCQAQNDMTWWLMP